MSYAMTVVRTQLGKGLEARLRADYAMLIPATREQEIDQALRRCLDKRRKAGTVLGDLLEEKKIAEDRARRSAIEYERLHNVANHASLIVHEMKDAAPLVLSESIKALASARANVDLALKTAKEHEDMALAAIQRALAAVPLEEIEHVGSVFDDQVEYGIMALVNFGVLLEEHGCSFMQSQLAGHVEDSEVISFGNVHYWPSPPLPGKKPGE